MAYEPLSRRVWSAALFVCLLTRGVASVDVAVAEEIRQHLNNADEAAQEEYERYFSQDDRKKLDASDFAGPGMSFPVNSQQDLDNAARLIGHAGDPAAVKSRLIAIAKRKGLTLPKSWQEATESIESTNATISPTASMKSRVARIKVLWLYDDAISLNGRQYPREAVDKLIQSGQLALSQPDGLPLTCYISHDMADQDNSIKMTGRVTQLWREGVNAMANVDIPDTHAGRDVAVLTSNRYLNTMSLRASGAEMKLDKQRGIPQVSGSNLTLQGIDFTASPGIPQARIQQVLLESADRAGICEVFDLTPESILIETQEKHMDIREEVIPSTTSGNTVGMTSDPTDDDYHKNNYEIPPMLSGDVTDQMQSYLREAHDHLAAVQGRSCAGGMESTKRKTLEEAGRMISGKNDKHLDAAHDNIAHALGMECESAQNKQPMAAQPDDNTNNMEAKKPMEAKITTDDALKLLESHGFKIERPKTREEVLQEAFDRKLEAQQAAMQVAMDAKLTALSEQFATIAAKSEPTPQRKSLVEGATTTGTKPAHQRPSARKNGDYLKEQLKEIPLDYLADRSFPLPDGVNVERLLEEMKLPLLGMYDDKYGLV